MTSSSDAAYHPRRRVQPSSVRLAVARQRHGADWSPESTRPRRAQRGDPAYRGRATGQSPDRSIARVIRAKTRTNDEHVHRKQSGESHLRMAVPFEALEMLSFSSGLRRTRAGMCHGRRRLSTPLSRLVIHQGAAAARPPSPHPSSTHTCPAAAPHCPPCTAS